MRKGYFFVFLTAMISGVSIFINRFAVIFVNPYVFTGLKNLAVGIFLFGLILLLKKQELFGGLSKRKWFGLIIIGIFGGGLPFLLFFKGLAVTSASQAAFIHKTLFVFAAILAVVFLKERPEKKFLFGGLLLLLGSLFLLKRLPYSSNQGDLLVFFAALLWAAESVFSKNLLKTISPFVVAWSRMFFGAIFIAVFLAITGQLSLAAKITLPQIFWIGITSVFLLGYVLSWHFGLKEIPVHQATAILLFGSPLTTALNLIFSGKTNFNEIISGALIIGGIFGVIGLKKLAQLIKKEKPVYVRP